MKTEYLLLHTEVTWLSKGNCLRHFYPRFDTMVEFLQESNSVLCEEQRHMKHDITFSSAVLTVFNEVHLRL